MNIVVRRVGSVPVVDLPPVLAFGSSVSAAAEVVHQLLDQGCPRILLNLEHTVTVDSVGVAAIVAWYKRARERGGRMELCRPGRKIRDLLAVTRIDRLIRVFDDEAQALNAT